METLWGGGDEPGHLSWLRRLAGTGHGVAECHLPRQRVAADSAGGLRAGAPARGDARAARQDAVEDRAERRAEHGVDERVSERRDVA